MLDCAPFRLALSPMRAIFARIPRRDAHQGPLTLARSVLACMKLRMRDRTKVRDKKERQ